MTIAAIVVKVLGTFWPLIKEYFWSGGDDQKGTGKKLLLGCTLIAVIVSLMVTVYLTEQAKQNLKVQEPIIRQYNQIINENSLLKEQLTQSQTDLLECESRTHKIIMECKSKAMDAFVKGNYVYDPVTKTMILKSTEVLKK